MFTSAGVSAGIDLALALVEQDHGPELARDVARTLVVFMQRPGGQSQFSTRLDVPAAHAGPLRTVLDSVTGDPAGEHTLTSIATRRCAAPSCAITPTAYRNRFSTTHRQRSDDQSLPHAGTNPRPESSEALAALEKRGRATRPVRAGS